MEQTKAIVESGARSDLDPEKLKNLYDLLGLGGKIEVVHGWVTSGEQGSTKRFHHAWMETDQWVIDMQNELTVRLPKTEYYGRYKANPQDRFTATEARELATRYGKYAGWNKRPE